MAEDRTSLNRSLEDSVTSRDRSIPPGNLVTDDLHRKLLEWFETSVEALEDGYTKSCRDRDYRDGFQWTESEIKDMADRGQPVVTSNRIERKIDYIRGTEMRQRVDPHCYPVGHTDSPHEGEAEAATDALRSLAEQERFPDTRSDAFDNLLVEGTCGGMVDVERWQMERIIRVRWMPWETLIWDYRSTRLDFSDARWVGTATWMDIDDAIATYGKTEAVVRILEEAVSHQPDESNDNYAKKPQQWARSDPEEVRLFHCFFKIRGDWHEAILTRAGWVVPPAKTKFVDDTGRTYCRLILQSARITRATEDRPAERYGLVRSLISPQDEINKRTSKQLHLLTMAQIHAEEGALNHEPEEAIQEVAKPDGYLSYAPRAMVDGKVRIDRNLDLSQGQAMLLQQSKMEIDMVGPTSPVMAADDRVRSGKAELARQEAGTAEVEPIFAALRRWNTRMYEAMWWCIRQWWPEEKWLRVTDDAERKGYRFVAVNRRMSRRQRYMELLQKQVPPVQAIQSVGLPPVIAIELYSQATQMAQQQVQAQAMMAQQQGIQIDEQQLQMAMEQMVKQMMMQSPLMMQEFRQNDLSRLRTDIVVDTVPDTAVVAQEEFMKLAEMARSGVGIPPAVVIRASQLRDKKEILHMMEPPPDPIAEQVQQIQIELLKAKVADTQAAAMEKQAHAQERMANAQFKLEHQSRKTEADAIKSVAEAGSISTPMPGPGGEPQ